MPKLSASPASAVISFISPEDVAVARRHQQRLARAAHHGVDLGEVVDRLRHVLGQAHAHDEVDVRQLLAERGHALDVGLAHAAALARVGVADVEHVAAGAAVAVLRVEHERRGVAAARLDHPVARRAGDGIVDQLGRDAHARAVDHARRPWRRSRPPARTAPRCPCRRAPPASLRARACRLSSSQIVRRASFMPPPPSLEWGTGAVVSAGWSTRWTDRHEGSVAAREGDKPRGAGPGALRAPRPGGSRRLRPVCGRR